MTEELEQLAKVLAEWLEQRSAFMPICSAAV